MKPTRPVLRYHGGKWKLAPWIIGHFPPHKVFVEPFGGAASVLLRKPRAYAEVYNDMDGEIVNLFRVLRDPDKAERLMRQLQLTPFARDEFVLSYVHTDDPMEQARRTVLRSFAGFGSGAASGMNTGFRANSNRSGTTPAHDWVNYPERVKSFTDRLAGVVIENRPAADVMTQHDGPDTLHYVDPPYPLSTRCYSSHHRSTYRHEMNDDQHRELAVVLHMLRGKVVLSGYPCELYDRELYADWQRVTVDALADGAEARIEVLWLNPAAALKAGTMPMFKVSP